MFSTGSSQIESPKYLADAFELDNAFWKLTIHRLVTRLTAARSVSLHRVVDKNAIYAFDANLPRHDDIGSKAVLLLEHGWYL